MSARRPSAIGARRRDKLQTFGCDQTFTKENAEDLRDGLVRHLGVDVKVVESTIPGGVWWCLELPAKYHAYAKVYVVGHRDGGSDGLNRHYGRKTDGQLARELAEREAQGGAS